MILKFPLDLKNLPKKPGVYLFLDKNKKPIYIGKAINLKNRLKSHSAKAKNEEKILFQIAKFLKIQVLNSEIAALIKESELIKKFQPRLNISFRDDKQYFYLCFSREIFPKISVAHQPKGFYLGPFTDGRSLKQSLSLTRKTFPFCSCPTPHLRRCLNSQIGLCFGFCCGKRHSPLEKEVKLYQENIEKIKKIFSGRNLALKKNLEKQIKNAIKIQDFEAAQILKSQIFGLEKVFAHQAYLKNHEDNQCDLTIKEFKRLLSLKLIKRIEFFDSSQFQGTDRVGAMTVWQDKNFKKSEWRLFKIRNEKAKDDLAMLKEVLERRFKHSKWQKPDVLIVDGGKNQLKTARDEIKNPKIKILALQKNSKHASEELLILQPDRKTAKTIKLSKLPQSLKNFLEDFSAKTHGFAVRFHRKRRDRV